MRGFIGEDDLDSFEGWMNYQANDINSLSASDLVMWKRIFLEQKQRVLETPKVGRMKLRDEPAEFRVAVAIEDAGLWLTLWVRRSSKGEVFVLLPRGGRIWDPHVSYHLDGTMHSKSHGAKLSVTKRQPLARSFRGTESLGTFCGHGPKRVGAECDPAAFNAVVRVPPGVLGPVQGGVQVDLLEPGCEPPEAPWGRILSRHTFEGVFPWISITVGTSAQVA